MSVSATGGDVAPPPAVPRWRRVALAVAMFFITGVNGFLQPFVPLYLSAAGLSKAQLGIVLALGTGAALLIQPTLGRLSDRYDARRPFMVAAALCGCVAYLAYRNAAGIATFVLLTALGVNGFQYLNAVGGVLVGRMAQASGRGGAAYVNYRVWGSVGYVVIGMVTGWLVNQRLPAGAALRRADLDPVFTYGPLLFLVIAAIAFAVPDVKAERPPNPRPLSPEPGGKGAGGLGGHNDEPRHANLNAFLLAFFLYQLGLYGASSFLPLYMRQFGASLPLITGMFAGGVVSEVLVMTQVGRWTDVYGRRPALAFSFLLMPLRLLLYVPATGPAWVMAVQTLHGLNFGIIGTIAVVFVNDLARDWDRGAMQARLAAAAGMGTAIGPVLCGKLADLIGIRGMFAAMSVVGIAAAILFLTRVKESHGAAQTHQNAFIRWLSNGSTV